MSVPLLPLAHHGELIAALPFVVPMLLLVGGLAVLAIRDRLGAGDPDERNGDVRA